MKRIITFLTAIVFIQLAGAQTMKKLWSACDDKNSAIPTDMTVDLAGNSYVTGYMLDSVYNDYQLHHFFLQKTDAAGTVQWTRYYPVADSFDAGRAVATDHDGNVYVTGERYDTACNICTINIPHSYLFTIKYDGAGNALWVNTYDGPDSTNQVAAELSVTPDGLVYVVANEKTYDADQGRTLNKMITQRITRKGETLWVRRLSGVTGNGITTDREGSVLIAGSYSPSDIYQLNQFDVIKYSKTGVLLWANVIYEYRKNGNAYFIATDSAGNIYVNGQTDTIAFNNNPRIMTAKFDANGYFQWRAKEVDATYTLPSFYGDYKIDASGNSYITGYRNLSSIDRDWLTIKRNPAGKMAWSSQYSDSLHSSSVPVSIGFDKTKNVYVAGYSYQGRSYQFTTIRYDRFGTQEWIKMYTRAPRADNFPIGLGLDTAGNVYVAGGSTGGICTVKYGKQPRAVPLQKMLPDEQIDSRLTLFPNPCKDVLFINRENLLPANYTYVIYDNTGRIIFAATLSLQESKGNSSINVQHLSAGMYFLTLSSGKLNYTQKFFKL